MGHFVKVNLENIGVHHSHLSDKSYEIDVLRDRLWLLRRRDRVLVEMRYLYGMSYSAIALAAGRDYSTIARYLRRLERGLIGGDYICVVRHKDNFDALELEVAYEHLLLGCGYRKVAKDLQVTQSQARKLIRRLRGWLDNQQLNRQGRRMGNE